MAFVTRSKKDFNQATGLHQIGPGSYNIEKKRENNQIAHKQHIAPFIIGDQRPLNKQINISMPGPGEYTHEPNFNIRMDQKIQPNAIYKSNIDRFYVKEKIIPDPGTYNPEFKPQLEDIQNQQQIIQFLKSKKQSKLKSGTSSIPHEYIYIDSDKTQPTSAKTVVKQGGVKGGVWGKQKEKRFNNPIKQETNDQIGPGVYNSDVEITKIFNKKPTNSFTSTTVRSTQQQNGFQASNFLLQKLKNEAMQLAETQQEIIDIENKNLQKETFITKENQNPGPGYYYIEKQLVKYKDKMDQSSRFQNSHCVTSVAPGEHSSNDFNQFYSTMQGKFTNNQRMKTQKSEVPGPGKYETNHDVQFSYLDREKNIKEKKRMGLQKQQKNQTNNFKILGSNYNNKVLTWAWTLLKY